jgi:hypothetical protein
MYYLDDKIVIHAMKLAVVGQHGNYLESYHREGEYKRQRLIYVAGLGSCNEILEESKPLVLSHTLGISLSNKMSPSDQLPKIANGSYSS